MATASLSMLRACTLDELRSKLCVVVRGGDRPIAVFYNDGKPRAIDNRCPHMGFPMSKGTCSNGMVTCHWHHARFDAASGCTFDFFADDVPAFDVEVRGGEVFVAPHPRGGNVREHALRRLRESMEMGIGLISAKSILKLLGEGVPANEIVREVALFGTRNRDGWSQGLTILTAMANLLPVLSEETAYLALYHGARRVSGDTSGQPPRRDRQPLDSDELTLDQLRNWLRHWTTVRHRDGAERTLMTAVRNGATQEQLGELVFGAASQRYYANGGHVFDFCSKSFELLDLIGWDHATDVLPTIVPDLVRFRGGEESDAWYHPIDLVALVKKSERELAEALARNSGKRWAGESALANELLVDDPARSLGAIVGAASAGATPPQLAKALAYAAALRVARFGSANEIGDWFSALHTFTYCNAVHQAIKRCPGPALAPAVLHGAVSVYLDRFLNVPPAKLPGEAGDRAALDAESRDGDELLRTFLDLLDAQQQVGRATRVVARYLELDLPINPLLDTLVRAVVREDADFHTFQMVEAGIRQYREWGGGVEGRHILIAVARYLAAHSPTLRGQYQTARIALRLHRGEEIHEEE